MATQSITNTSRIPMQPWIPSEAAQKGPARESLAQPLLL